VREETIQVLSYINSNKDSEKILAKFMSNVFLRSDVLDNLTSLLIKGT
jgi:hypothetical protein